MSILADNIRALRARYSTQTEFGEAVGVGQSTVVRWEKGSDPKPDNLLALAQLAGCSIEQLVTTSLAEIQAAPKKPVPTADELSRMIARAMTELPMNPTNADYQRVVASSLHTQLKRFQAHGGYRDDQDEATSPDTDAPPPKPTNRPSRGGSRNP